MKNCSAITQKDAKCTKTTLWSSKYCWHHADRNSGTILACVFFLIGSLLTLGVVYYQERYPKLSTECNVDEHGDPSKITCDVKNSGRAAANEVYISFNKILPLDTKLYASPELGMKIIESDSPPNPNNQPFSAEQIKAFSVRIPRINKNSTVSFTVQTVNQDNKVAADKIMKIRETQKNILKDFWNAVTKKYPSEATKWDIDDVIVEMTKDQNFFLPSKCNYEGGIFLVKYFSEDDLLSRSIHRDKYSKYKKEFINIFNNRPQFEAPIVHIKTTEASTTWAIFPPYINSTIYFDIKVAS